MKHIFYNENLKRCKVSLILLDWSCRESFHILNYLKNQNVDRDLFEIIWIEYFDNVPQVQKEMLDKSLKDDKYPILDQWLVMDMPKNTYYHKHLMYNVGIALARGEIVMIGDSDAMVSENFIKTIIDEFSKDKNIIFHMDQFRSVYKGFYPFNYPTIKDVLSKECINNKNGKTKGVLDKEDPLHTRNYGACFCAIREDIINIGGADEHIDYLGHICGPYDLTFRLINDGKREIWSQSEFTYHTWHPGQAGEGNYLGPHDGKHMSSTALDALKSNRVKPLLENRVIKYLRENKNLTLEEKLEMLINPNYYSDWDIDKIDYEYAKNVTHLLETNYFGYNILAVDKIYYAVKLGITIPSNEDVLKYNSISSDNIKDLKKILLYKQFGKDSILKKLKKDNLLEYYIFLFREFNKKLLNKIFGKFSITSEYGILGKLKLEVFTNFQRVEELFELIKLKENDVEKIYIFSDKYIKMYLDYYSLKLNETYLNKLEIVKTNNLNNLFENLFQISNRDNKSLIFIESNYLIYKEELSAFDNINFW